MILDAAGIALLQYVITRRKLYGLSAPEEKTLER